MSEETVSLDGPVEVAYDVAGPVTVEIGYAIVDGRPVPRPETKVIEPPAAVRPKSATTASTKQRHPHRASP